MKFFPKIFTITIIIIVVIASMVTYQKIKDDQELKQMAALAFSVYSDGQLSGLEAYEDPGLVDFYKNNLQNVCPYYVPDGSTYRDCILDLIKKEQKRLKIGNEEPGEVNAYCSEGAKKTADDYTLGYVDTYNTCRLYKLQEMK